MTDANATPEPAPLDATCVERCRGVLERLAETGMARIEALDADETLSTLDKALAFTRLARAVRLTLMLDLRLDELASGGLAALLAERARAEAPDPADRAESDRPDPTPRDRPDREAPDEALSLIRRPMTEVVAAVCKATGATPEETEQAQAPFAALVANDDGPDHPAPTGRAGFQPETAAVGAPRPPSALKSRLMAGAAARPLGP